MGKFATFTRYGVGVLMISHWSPGDVFKERFDTAGHRMLTVFW